MTDLIKRSDALDAVLSIIPIDGKVYADTVTFNIQRIPSADRPSGEWSFVGYDLFKCTSCGVLYSTQQLNGLRNYDTDPFAPKYCPNCGARMKGASE